MKRPSSDFQGSLYGLLLGIFYPSGIDHPSVVDIMVPIFLFMSVGAIIGSIFGRRSRQAAQEVGKPDFLRRVAFDQPNLSRLEEPFDEKL